MNECKNCSALEIRRARACARSSKAIAEAAGLRKALRECRTAWESMEQCLEEDEIRVSAVGHMSGWTLMQAALAPQDTEGITDSNLSDAG